MHRRPEGGDEETTPFSRPRKRRQAGGEHQVRGPVTRVQQRAAWGFHVYRRSSPEISSLLFLVWFFAVHTGERAK